MHSCFLSYHIFINISIEFDYIQWSKSASADFGAEVTSDVKKLIESKLSADYTTSASITDGAVVRANPNEYAWVEQLLYTMQLMDIQISMFGIIKDIMLN